IVSLLEQMSGEGMPKRMAAHGFLDSHVAHGLSHGTLNSPILDVVPPFGTRTGILAPAIGRKEPLPAPLGCGARILALEGVGQIDGSEAFGDVALVDPLDLRKPGSEILSDHDRKRHAPVLVPFSLANNDQAAAKLDVLDS